ncbi:MAG: bacillithiol biosynthesis cysteine-adding enzyme BshC [Psychroflexus sp.]|nr:bacillithiol biosynthesis cysteine-adding enzyme BshC [Psychroflexus sp.]
MIDCFKYRDTNHFSELVYDYVEQNENFDDFISYFPSLENLEKQAADKAKSYPASTRPILVEALRSQYAYVETSQQTKDHIEALLLENTFTITTGHQLNLFTGPLYFIYKIISTVNLAEEMTEKYPDKNFVPIYWMASEDHDFEEINFFDFKRKKIQWSSEQTGAVGEFKTEDIDALIPQLEEVFGTSKRSQELIQLFKRAYLEHSNLSDATFYLVNQLFKSYGLVVLEPQKASLKKLFINEMKTDLLDQKAATCVEEQSKRLVEKGYQLQVNPREINLFYLKENERLRIARVDDQFQLVDTDIRFTKDAFLKELEEHPERFSPNVIMRPLYQEVILPNICYIGGGGELAYWLQLKSFFDKQNTPFPVLLLRNSVLIYSDKTEKKMKNLNLSLSELFLTPDQLAEKQTHKITDIKIDFSQQMDFLKDQFTQLYQLSQRTDPSFEGAVAAQEQKQLNGLKHLEKRLMKAQKRKLKDELDRVLSLQELLFPNEGLQERSLNFSEIYADCGSDFIKIFKTQLKPLSGEFTCLRLDVYNSIKQ